MTRSKLIATTLALVLALVTAACGGGPASGSGATVVDDAPEPDATEEQTAPDEPDADDATAADDPVADDEGAEDEQVTDRDEDAAASALGTRDNPLPLGTRIEMGDWTVAVTEVTLDATEQVLEENRFNDPPVEGRQFVVFTVDATYEGDDSGTAWLDLSWAIVGSAGNTFATGSDDYCGVIPGSLDDTGETFPGGSVSGDVCFSVASDQLDGATIRLEVWLSFEDTRAFFALE